MDWEVMDYDMSDLMREHCYGDTQTEAHVSCNL